MSSTLFAAAPGTYVIDREQGASVARKIPVVGFTHIQGGIVFPLCAINHSGLTRGRALVTPDGFVTDPSFGVVCGSTTEWMSLTDSESYWSAKFVAKEAMPTPGPKLFENHEDYGLAADEATGHRREGHDTEYDDGSDLRREQRAVTETVSKEADRRIPDDVTRKVPSYPPQRFINKTFWRMPSTHAVFLVEGGDDAPGKRDDRFVKIKREEFQALKKSGSTVLSVWQDGEVGPSEEPADEDDGSSLI